MNKNDLLQLYTNPQPIPSQFNEGFSQYETVKYLIGLTNNLITNQNLGADEIADLEGKKVSLEYYLNDLANNRKLSPTGDFSGKWHGHEMVETDPGIQIIVNDHTNELLDYRNVKTIYDIKSDGSDITTKLISALNDNKSLYFPDGEYTINGVVTITNKDIIMYGNNVTFKGTGGFTFDSDISVSTFVNDIVDGSSSINSLIDCNVGDMLLINGSISHSLYTPNRYLTTSVLAKVIDIAGNMIRLDRKINFSLSNVTANIILNPYKVDIKNIIFDGVSMNVSKSNNVNIDNKFIGNTDISLSINQCSNIKVNFKGINLKNATQGIVLNDCNSFDVNVIGVNIGKQDSSGTKAVRCNGLSNGKINAILSDSWHNDVVIYGARNVNVDVISNGSGRYFRDNNIITPNRNESVQFSECDNLEIHCNMDNVDDQGLELLACYKCKVYPKINTLVNSTEGAIVVKGGSQDISIVNPFIRANNPYSIKVECTNNLSDSANTTRTNDIKIINPNIVNFNASGYGIILRDSPITVNANVKILGGYIKAMYPIMGNDINHNGLTVLNSLIESNGGHGINSIGDYLLVSNVIVLNGNVTTVRAVISSGANDKVNKVTSDGVVYVRANARDNFNIKNYMDNRVPYIWFDTKSWHIYCDKLQYRVNSIPVEYIWTRDTKLGLINATGGGFAEIICIEDGTPGVWKTCNPISV